MNDIDQRGSQAEDRKDLQENIALINNRKQLDITNLQNEQLDLISENIDRSFDHSDDSRWKVIPQIDLYKDQNSFLFDEINTFNIDKTQRNNETFGRIVSNR